MSAVLIREGKERGSFKVGLELKRRLQAHPDADSDEVLGLSAFVTSVGGVHRKADFKKTVHERGSPPY